LKAKINTSRTGGRTVQIRNIKARIKKLQRWYAMIKENSLNI
jgi:hypothetical protein